MSELAFHRPEPASSDSVPTHHDGGNAGHSGLHRLRHAWWAPQVGFLLICELWLAVVFVVGDGTSNVLDAESTVAGVTLPLAARRLWF